jgi:DNA-binding winged helix-turn-helix (wHTH) protein
VEFSFGEHVLDLDPRELRRGAELVALEPQVFDLLVYLVRNGDRVVSKDKLLAAVWGGRIVAEPTLTSRISALCRAVGDSGDAQRLIRTVAPQGPSLRRRRRGDPERCSAAKTSAYAVREVVDRNITVRQYRRRSRIGIFLRRRGRGDHHRALAYPLALRHRPQFELYL